MLTLRWDIFPPVYCSGANRTLLSETLVFIQDRFDLPGRAPKQRQFTEVPRSTKPFSPFFARGFRPVPLVRRKVKAWREIGRRRGRPVNPGRDCANPALGTLSRPRGWSATEGAGKGRTSRWAGLGGHPVRGGACLTQSPLAVGAAELPGGSGRCCPSLSGPGAADAARQQPGSRDGDPPIMTPPTALPLHLSLPPVMHGVSPPVPAGSTR